MTSAAPLLPTCGQCGGDGWDNTLQSMLPCRRCSMDGVEVEMSYEATMRAARACPDQHLHDYGVEAAFLDPDPDAYQRVRQHCGEAVTRCPGCGLMLCYTEPPTPPPPVEVKPKRRWWMLYLAAILCAGIGVAPPAKAAHWTVERLVAHAGHSAAACQVAPHWGPKQNRCALRVAFWREPRLGREAVKIAGCETGGTWDERMVDGPYVGLGNFDRRTWDDLPSWLSSHSPFDPPWMGRAMRYLRLTDGDWHEWPACSKLLW